VSLAPRHSWAWNQLGSAAWVRSDLAGAEDCYRRAIAGEPVNPEAYFNLALVLERTGRAAAAVPLYRAFYALKPLGRGGELERLRARFGWP
jgi:Flp pilus assembly protein TadD